tara:strand:- start:51 stop:359 length:309 start_codon:yes stop_codon:yes gene_type:complete
MAIRKNITSATTTTLIQKGSSETGNISKVLITNHDDSDSCVVKIQLNDGAGSPTTFVINETDIPARASLLLEDGVRFQSSLFRLEVTTSTGGSNINITIIIE